MVDINSTTFVAVSDDVRLEMLNNQLEYARSKSPFAPIREERNAGSAAGVRFGAEPSKAKIIQPRSTTVKVAVRVTAEGRRCNRSLSRYFSATSKRK